MRLILDMLFNYRCITGGLPCRQLAEVIPIETPLDIVITEKMFSWGWDARFAQEGVYLAAIVASLRPSNVVELGTSRGKSTLIMALNATHSSVVYTIDLPPEASSTVLRSSWSDLQRQSTREPGEEFRGSTVESRIVQVFGDTAELNLSDQLADLYGKADLVFVDGAHTKEYVRNDTELALKLAHPGTVVLWHDYNRFGESRGVTEFLDEFSRSHNVSHLHGSSLAVMIVEQAPALTDSMGSQEYSSSHARNEPELPQGDGSERDAAGDPETRGKGEVQTQGDGERQIGQYSATPATWRRLMPSRWMFW
jgi:predicted O-methyltransferase YrrM